MRPASFAVLVYVKIDSLVVATGYEREFVELARYLGRRTVYRAGVRG